MFGQVAELLITTEEASQKDEHLSDSFHNLKFPYASRPMRVVMNRPLFQDYENIMAMKLGDFLRVNSKLVLDNIDCSNRKISLLSSMKHSKKVTLCD
jgi:hypothetical protein